MVALLGLVAGCVPRHVPVRDSSVLLLFGDLPGGTELAGSPEGARRFGDAWSAVTAGNLGRADERLRSLLRFPPRDLLEPALYPVHTALGAVQLMAGRVPQALDFFETALRLRPDYREALAGQAAARHALGDDEAALESLLRIRQQAPRHPSLAALLEPVRRAALHRIAERSRLAEERGDADGALEEFSRALELSPGQVELEMKMGDLARRIGRRERAAAAYRAAAALRPEDPEPWLRLGRVLLEDRRYAEAREAFDTAASLPGGLEEARQAVTSLREDRRGQLADDPRLRRALEAPGVDRATLAALLAANLPALGRLAPTQGTVIVTDISGSWARQAIQDLVALGILDVYENHTFRPERPVARVDLAQAVSRVLQAYRGAGRLAERPWDARELVDVPPEHLHYRDVAESLRYGILTVNGEGLFRPYDHVSGGEVGSALERLRAKFP